MPTPRTWFIALSNSDVLQTSHNKKLHRRQENLNVVFTSRYVEFYLILRSYFHHLRRSSRFENVYRCSEVKCPNSRAPGDNVIISKDNRAWPLDPMARRWSVFLSMKSIHDSKPLTFQARLCRKYSNSIHYCSLSYGNRNKRPSFICRSATLPVRTRGYIGRQDNERLSAVAAAPSAPTATAQKKKNRIRRRNRSRRVELSFTHLVPQLHPELPHAAPLVGADVLCRRVKASDITNHSRRGNG